ncbi:hypothetical protein LPTSP4_25120 [Leptospira ryugenii]|uniref:HTH arsR-type domain-containing protein n=1 Tax=Leptospira ryugenii TaxID=1917863 RepID=A0A2P2E266_9LEPT|nr:metalloregulator ArsR/SmtB family transcription factor [Leptospira ryugenii]GBF50981.1 hypothetical protein LPTSP4_25120 [Leptospira ryugenii]
MQDTLSHIFFALSDPTRRSLLEALSRGDATVSDLASPLLKQMSLPAITKHIKVLVNAGLVTKSVDAQFRQCSINHEAFKDVTDWMEQYRLLWGERFDRLDAYLLNTSKQKDKSRHKETQTFKKRKS